MNAEDIIKQLDEEANTLVGEPELSLKEEEEALTNQETEDVDEDTSEPLKEPEATVVDTQNLEEESEETTDTQKRTNWKKRFINYKAKTDETIYSLRQDNLHLRESVSRMMNQVKGFEEILKEKSSKEDPFKGVFTEEEVEAFGSEGLDVIKKAALAIAEQKLKPVQEDLMAQKKANQETIDREIKREKELEYREFLKDLQRYAPGYAKLDTDPKFIQWLQGADEGSRYTRKTLFLNAERMRDAERVAEFFNKYESLYNRSKDIDKHITPNTSRASAQPIDNRNKQVIDQAFIDKFTMDFAKGRIGMKEAKRIEALIDDYYEKRLKNLRAA